MKLDDPVFVSADDGELVESNDVFKDTIGADSNSSTVFEVWPELEAFWGPASKLHSEGSQLRADVSATGSDNRKLIFDVLLTTIDSLGTIVGICRDVTADRSREKDFEHRAVTDQLTGVFNRHQLELLLTQSIRSARRQKSVGSFLYIDIDEFKQLNDEQGHSAGDVVLKKVVEVLTQNLRDSDVVGRLGGDEFGVILQGADIDASTKKANQLIETVTNATSSMISGSVELSIGAAPFPVDGWSTLDVIESADKAMYEAKKISGSRVEVTDRNLGSHSGD
mgnify:FL=1